ncbi:RsfA family transcriptional regulator [Jeotgalibacillus salarius]|uniref:RsfA family transcriptional regulator n=1 Tax=Jeotgalibacillus salarius TaxID=546023 RepID=A0A4Y8LMG9_9BACL|nr:RsfA family transcriptional regulator [Jeotgalibacillus salarius]TFE04194.1 RsfA family transcriptional regulator [Jeotgalibacillus salarius]
MKNRQDAWMEEDDLLLADTVLRHVREGSTQLNAFEEAGDKLDRTSAACGFRWNAVVRSQFEHALSLAKKQRKQRNRLLGKDHSGKKKVLYQPDFSVPEGFEVEEPSLMNEEFAEEHAETVPAFAQPAHRVSELTLNAVIAYLQQLDRSGSLQQSDRLSSEVKVWQEKCRALEKKVLFLEERETAMKEDYDTLMQIMNRARKLVLFNEQEQANTFKMDRNGNLEKVAEH